ncbi:MAG: hypothetical protein Q8903_09295 [Bacteroidota bacterium]|nr:hypothetical protein [Bacteroidota bacterium]
MSRPAKNPKEFDDIRLALKQIKEHVDNQYYHLIPELPEWCNKDYCFNDNGSDYSINIYKLTCTCQSFIDKTGLYDPRDIRSLCKHIYYKMARTKVMGYLDDLSCLLLKDYMHSPDMSFYSFQLLERNVIIGLAQTPWVNVYTKAKRTKEDVEGNYTKYSYNINQKRWSYNISPYPKNLIIDAINLSR